jgi:hypothetical protein
MFPMPVFDFAGQAAAFMKAAEETGAAPEDLLEADVLRVPVPKATKPQSPHTKKPKEP